MASKCKCGNENWMGCKNCSKYKFSVMLTSEHANLKWTMPNGNRVNPVFYSPVKENFKTPEVVFQGMLKRFNSSKQNSFTKFNAYAREVLFYKNPSNQNDTPILTAAR